MINISSTPHFENSHERKVEISRNVKQTHDALRLIPNDLDKQSLVEIVYRAQKNEGTGEDITWLNTNLGQCFQNMIPFEEEEIITNELDSLLTKQLRLAIRYYFQSGYFTREQLSFATSLTGVGNLAIVEGDVASVNYTEYLKYLEAQNVPAGLLPRNVRDEVISMKVGKSAIQKNAYQMKQDYELMGVKLTDSQALELSALITVGHEYAHSLFKSIGTKDLNNLPSFKSLTKQFPDVPDFILKIAFQENFAVTMEHYLAENWLKNNIVGSEDIVRKLTEEKIELGILEIEKTRKLQNELRLKVKSFKLDNLWDFYVYVKSIQYGLDILSSKNALEQRDLASPLFSVYYDQADIAVNEIKSLFI